MEEEYQLQLVIKELINDKLINAAHDCSDGGLFVTMLEMASNYGFDVNTKSTIRKDAFLFGESQGRIVVSVGSDQLTRFQDKLSKSSVDSYRLGEVIESKNILIDNNDFGKVGHYEKISINCIQF